jgi:hypothetical protein
VFSRAREIQRSRTLLEQVHNELQGSGSENIDQLFNLWAGAELKVAEEDWNEARLMFEQLIKFATEHSLLWHTNRMRVNWATALLARGEPNDIEEARQLLEFAIEEDQKMGADGFVQMVAEQLAALE